jgi:hypothetical protein
MENRKVDTAPVRDKDPVKAKPGDFEPPLGTTDPIVIDPPAEGRQCCTPAAENREDKPRH